MKYINFYPFSTRFLPVFGKFSLLFTNNFLLFILCTGGFMDTPAPNNAPFTPIYLIYYRNARGWTQAELAQQAGIHWRTVSNYETGTTKNPRLDVLVALAKALGVNVDRLLRTGS